MLACIAGLALAGCSQLPQAARDEPNSAAANLRPAALGRPASLAAVTSWTYQLQNYPNRLSDIGHSGFQMAVVDYSLNGTASGEWTANEVTAAKSNKLLIAYLSVGEAEEYRYYWQSTWRPGSPSWLVQENPDWEGNYVVRYWDATWQSIILGYLDRIIAQGFDGAYLDIIDGYYSFPTRATAKADMINWVCKINSYAKAKNPAFKIITQNASELIWEKSGALAACIDGTSQEETWFRATDRRTTATSRKWQIQDYNEYKRLGKAVFTVDYARQSANIKEAYDNSRIRGYVPYVTGVNLDTLRVNAGFDPAPGY